MCKNFFQKGFAAILSCFVAVLLFAATIPETEPNNSLASAQTVAVGDTITGIVSGPNDPDYFAITLAPGVYRIGFTYPNTWPTTKDIFEVLDANGNALPHNCFFYIPFAHLDVVKVCQTATYYIKISASLQGPSGSDYAFTVWPDLEDHECDDTAQTAHSIMEPTVTSNKISVKGDEDYYRLRDVQPGIVSIAVNTPNDPNYPNTPFTITLWSDPNGTPIATSALGSNDLNTSVTQAGDLYVRIQYANPDTSSLYPYSAAFIYSAASVCTFPFDASSVQVDSATCGGVTDGSISVPTPTGGVAPYLYQMTNGAMQSSGNFSGLAEGAYDVTITDVDGCTAAFTVEVPCKPCALPVIGVVNAPVTEKTVNISAVLQNVDYVSVTWGDGTVSDSLTHTYAQNGNYTVNIVAYNSCGSSTATTFIQVLTAKFRLGKIANAIPGEIYKLPLICTEGEFSAGGWTFNVMMLNPLIAEWLGLESGTLSSTGTVVNLANGRGAGTFQPNGSETVSIGDTVMFFVFKIKDTATPGDSTIVDLNGTLPFVFSAFINGSPVEIPTSLDLGSISVAQKVQMRVQVKTPTGLPIPNAKVQFSSPDSTFWGTTNTAGICEMELPYSTQYEISCQKDTTVLAGVNPNDVFLLNRIIVLLPNNNLTAYSYIAADFDCSSLITVNDGVLILRYIVGLLAQPPCAQYMFIPVSHNMGAYPSPTYFNCPTAQMLNNPSASAVNQVDFVGVIRGDVDGNAIPHLTSGPDDRGTTTWTYAVQQEDQNLRVSLRAEAFPLIGGIGNFHFDNEKFEFVGAEMAQDKHGNLLVVNDAAVKNGQLTFAFVNQQGRNIAFDHELPLIELVFRTQKPAHAFDLRLSTEGPTAAISNSDGQISNIALERRNEPLAQNRGITVFPNPSKDRFFVNFASPERASVEVFNALGQLVKHTANSEATWQIEIPSHDLLPGTYTLRVQTAAGQVFASKIEVLTH